MSAVEGTVAADGPAPSVLFVAGLGGAWFDWLPVVRDLGSAVRPLYSDRTEVPEWSDDDLAAYAADLVEVLDAAGVDRAVLVGHSMGGWYVEACARLHPSRVAGLVLVDASLAPVPHQGPAPVPDRNPAPVPNRDPAPAPEDDHPRPHRLRRALARAAWSATDAAVGHTAGWDRTGPALRSMALPGRRSHADAEETRPLESGFFGGPDAWRAAVADWAAYPVLRAELARLRERAPLPDTRVEIVVAGPGRHVPSFWAAAQRRQARALGRGRRRPPRLHVVPHAPHLVQLTHPEVVADAIRDALG